MNSSDLDRDVVGCAAAHQRLLTALDLLDDETARRPSRLPDWTVGHVVTHIARNADGFTRMLVGAERGEIVAMYEGGTESRTADIEAGAVRPAEDLVADARLSIYRLEQTWAGLTEVGWQGRGMTVFGEVPAMSIPGRRQREVEIHHIDLGLGYEFEDLPSEYLRLELNNMTALWASRKPMGLTDLPKAALALPDPARLAWLMGRRVIDGLAPAGIY